MAKVKAKCEFRTFDSGRHWVFKFRVAFPINGAFHFVGYYTTKKGARRAARRVAKRLNLELEFVD